MYVVFVLPRDVPDATGHPTGYIIYQSVCFKIFFNRELKVDYGYWKI